MTGKSSQVIQFNGLFKIIFTFTTQYQEVKILIYILRIVVKIWKSFFFIERIKQGFSLDAILEDIEESIDPDSGKTKRIHLLSRKDLCNIMQSRNGQKVKGNLKTAKDETVLK